ncbi:MAG: T9SS type A sorting domain-containing protein, partial [Ignavibacteriaceae bacterium]|nr:T9SS type A sorting domain-containing protein [Ignavibacteriaceae bacterium]
PIKMNRGYSLDAGGVVNNDGYSDIIIGLDWKIKVYAGSPQFDTTYDYLIDDADSIGFTLNMGFAGDINNDGYDEIFAAAPNFPDPENPVGKDFIFSYNKISIVKDQTDNYPSDFRLFQNYPNPFNPLTNLQYSVNNRQFVIIKIYDVLGREVCTLVNEEKSAGEYKIIFDTSKYNLSSGIYFCELNIKEGGSSRIKMILLK